MLFQYIGVKQLNSHTYVGNIVNLDSVENKNQIHAIQLVLNIIINMQKS